METITPEEIRRARAECERLQSWDPLDGLLPADDDMPDPAERFAEWDWDAYIEPDSEY
jgi:hypothetical protein